MGNKFVQILNRVYDFNWYLLGTIIKINRKLNHARDADIATSLQEIEMKEKIIRMLFYQTKNVTSQLMSSKAKGFRLNRILEALKALVGWSHSILQIGLSVSLDVKEIVVEKRFGIWRLISRQRRNIRLWYHSKILSLKEL